MSANNEHGSESFGGIGRGFEVDRPIFIVGAGRSGTTPLYNLLAGHPDLAWFSNHTDRWPRLPQAAFFSRLYLFEPIRGRSVRGLPIPSEGHAIWNYCRPVQDSPGDPPLTEVDVTAGDSARARWALAMHMHYQGRPRFINKNTRNTRRIRYLNRIFEDALFIHLIRDPRATVASLLMVDWWPDLKVWCCDKVTPQEWAAQNKDPAALGARLWAAEVQRALDDKAELPSSRYLEVRYEGLVARPKEILSEVLAFCELGWNDRSEKLVENAKFHNMNFKYWTQLSNDQIAEIEALTDPVARQLGFA